jgi:HEAT repeat protein
MPYCADSAKRKLAQAKPKQQKQLMQLIDCLRSSQKDVDFNKLSVQGLKQERIAGPERDQAFELRFLLEMVLGCKLAYRVRDRALVIVAQSEVDKGIAAGTITFQNLREGSESAAKAIPVISPPVHGSPQSKAAAIVPKEGETPLAERQGGFRAEVIQDVASLVGRGDFETAALMVFYGKKAIQAWDIIHGVSTVEKVIDRDTAEIVRLELDLISIEGRRIEPHLLLAAALLENYLPMESARIILELIGRALVSREDAADILACVAASNVKRCALILFKMILQGGAKWVDLAIRDGYGSLGLRGLFEELLGELHAGWRTRVYSPMDYNGKGSIYKDGNFMARAEVIMRGLANKLQVRQKAPSAVAVEVVSKEIVAYGESPFISSKKLEENTPDAYMRMRVQKFLDRGENRLAAAVVFGEGIEDCDGYLNMQYFSSEENGRMLAAMSARNLYRQVVVSHKFKPAVYEKEQEMLEVLLEAFYCFKGKAGDLERATGLFDAMIRIGEKHPNLKWAAYWLLLEGAAFFKFNDPHKTPSEVAEQSERIRGFYIDVVENLAERHRSDNWRDLRGFMKHGCFQETELPTGNNDRKMLVKFYWKILNGTANPIEARGFAARMLGKLGADEHLEGTLTLARKMRNARDDLWKAVVMASFELYGGLAPEKRSDHHLSNLFMKDMVDHCAEELIELGETALPALAQVLKIRDYDYSETRKAAIGAIGKIGGKVAIVTLMQALEGDLAAAEALGELGAVEAAPALTRVLMTSEEWRERTLAAKALLEIDEFEDQFARDRARAYYLIEGQYWEGIAELGEAASPALNMALEEYYITEWQIHVIELLGKIKDRNCVDQLIELSLPRPKPRWSMRGDRLSLAAIKALANIGDTRAVDPLMRMVRKEKDEIKKQAVWALGELGDERAFNLLASALEYQEPGVRAAAAGALGKLGNSAARQPLLEAVCDEQSAVRAAAAESLKQVGEKADGTLLIALLEQDEDVVKTGAARALTALAVPEAFETVLSVLQKQPFLRGLRDSEIYFDRQWEKKQLKIALIEALGASKDTRAVDVLADFLKNDGWYQVRRAAARALGAIDDPKVIGPLVKALADFDGGTSTIGSGSEYEGSTGREASAVLANIRSAEVAAALKEAFQEKADWTERLVIAETLLMIAEMIDEATRALAQAFVYIHEDKVEEIVAMGETAMPALESALFENGWLYVPWTVGPAAVKALSRMGGQKAFDILSRIQIKARHDNKDRPMGGGIFTWGLISDIESALEAVAKNLNTVPAGE